MEKYAANLVTDTKNDKKEHSLGAAYFFKYYMCKYERNLGENV